MRLPAARAALTLLILLLIPCVHPGWAATVTLTSPRTAVCVTDVGAVFTVEKGALLPVRGEFAISPPGAQPLKLSTDIASSAQPGGLARVYVWSTEPLDSITVQVGAAGKQPVSQSTGFKAASQGAVDVWAVLLGIPPAGAARAYTLRMTAVAGPRTFLVLRPFTVTARTFFSETISLTADMTGLMTTPDPRKKAEAESLALLLTTPHAEAVFETGAFLDPLPGARRTAGYGDRREYLYPDKTTSLSIHGGVDIASPQGTTVAACGRGRVVFAGERVITGNTVVIEHLPGLFSLYDHLWAVIVKEGDAVGRGEAIGMVGMTGFATGPHLHWEVRAMGTAVDPDVLVAGPLLDKTPDFIDINAKNEGR
jgi:murein DD-endopeptidase MepM/ murein hydrolase activator NlpD